MSKSKLNLNEISKLSFESQTSLPKLHEPDTRRNREKLRTERKVISAHKILKQKSLSKKQRYAIFMKYQNQKDIAKELPTDTNDIIVPIQNDRINLNTSLINLSINHTNNMIASNLNSNINSNVSLINFNTSYVNDMVISTSDNNLKTKLLTESSKISKNKEVLQVEKKQPHKLLSEPQQIQNPRLLSDADIRVTMKEKKYQHNIPQEILFEQMHSSLDKKNVDENVGVDSAHYVEKKLEFSLSKAKQLYNKFHTKSAYQKLEHRSFLLHQEQGAYHFKKNISSITYVPEQSNQFSRFHQKQQIKKQYTTMFRMANSTHHKNQKRFSIAQNTIQTTSKVGVNILKNAVTVISKNPNVILSIIVITGSIIMFNLLFYLFQMFKLFLILFILFFQR